MSQVRLYDRLSFNFTYTQDVSMKAKLFFLALLFSSGQSYANICPELEGEYHCLCESGYNNTYWFCNNSGDEENISISQRIENGVTIYDLPMLSYEDDVNNGYQTKTGFGWVADGLESQDRMYMEPESRLNSLRTRYTATCSKGVLDIEDSLGSFAKQIQITNNYKLSKSKNTLNIVGTRKVRGVIAMALAKLLSNTHIGGDGELTEEIKVICTKK